MFLKKTLNCLPSPPVPPYKLEGRGVERGSETGWVINVTLLSFKRRQTQQSQQYTNYPKPYDNF
jgi:hypothetical protein